MSRRILQGVVVSDKCDKTVTVRVERRVMHPLYGKIVREFKKYPAHDAENIHKIGDVVKIRESKPYSKTKAWEILAEEALGAEKA